MNDKTLRRNVNIRPATMEKLEQLCEEMGWSKAEAVERLINYWNVNRHQGIELEQSSTQT
jgi:hypothetical protein